MDNICTCKSYGCEEQDGVKLNSRVIRKHTLRDEAQAQKDQAQVDKAAKVEEAQRKADQAIQNKLDAITLHLSNIVLSGSISEPLSPPGGRLRSKTCSQAEPLESTSRQHTIQLLLLRLNEIKATVIALDTSVSSSLKGFDELDLGNLPSFPLRNIEAESLGLQTDLSLVTFKADPAVAMKVSIEKQLSGIAERLASAKALWLSKQKARKAAQPGIAYSTGKCYNHLSH